VGGSGTPDLARGMPIGGGYAGGPRVATGLGRPAFFRGVCVCAPSRLPPAHAALAVLGFPTLAAPTAVSSAPKRKPSSEDKFADMSVLTSLPSLGGVNPFLLPSLPGLPGTSKARRWRWRCPRPHTPLPAHLNAACVSVFVLHGSGRRGHCAEVCWVGAWRPAQCPPIAAHCTAHLRPQRVVRVFACVCGGGVP
jgi:hypothetical protein